VLAYNKIGWFRDFVDGAFKVVGAAIGWVVGFVKAHWPLMVALIIGPIGIAVGLVIKYWKQISDGVSAAVSWVVGFVKNNWQLLLGLLTGPIGFATGLIMKYWKQISSGFSSAYNAVVKVGGDLLKWVGDLPGKILGYLGKLGSLLYQSGADMIRGLINGIKSIDVSSVLSGIAKGAVSSFKSMLGIKSPSRVFHQLGVYINTGLVDGLTSSTPRVKAATRRIESLLLQTYQRVSDQKGSRGASNGWVKSHQAALKSLMAYAKREDKILRGLAAQRDSVAKKISDAQKKLAGLQKAWADEVKNVASGIMQGFSVVTTAPQEGFALSAQDVVNKMRDQMSRAVQFAAQLQTLKTMGLRADLIAQIAEAGVDQGGATAAALAAASKGQIAEINQMQSATLTAANSAGKAVADAMYGSGIKAAQGLVKGLQSQQKAIEKQMMAIARSMQAAIKKALGIKSPSRVFAAIGSWIPRGLAVGVAGAEYHATRAVHRLAGSVANAGAFPGSGLALAGAGGSMVVNNHVHVTVEGHVLTERGLRDVVEGSMLKLGGRNPKTYAPYKR
jgi:hypothetical protein